MVLHAFSMDFHQYFQNPGPDFQNFRNFQNAGPDFQNFENFENGAQIFENFENFENRAQIIENIGSNPLKKHAKPLKNIEKSLKKQAKQ